jgi:hypothetical protein
MSEEMNSGLSLPYKALLCATVGSVLGVGNYLMRRNRVGAALMGVASSAATFFLFR